MKCILMLEIETDAPLEAFQESGNVHMDFNKGGMIWKPNIVKLQVFKAEEEDEEEDKNVAITPARRNRALPFNMGMHGGMSLVGSND